jgi:hypothetical protein
MNEKSYVSLEKRVCLVCGNEYETGSLLLDRRLIPSMHRHTTVGWGLCAEHQKCHEDGFLALVECDPQKSGTAAPDGSLKPEDAYRTGVVAFLKRETFNQLFTVQVPVNMPAVYV